MSRPRPGRVVGRAGRVVGAAAACLVVATAAAPGAAAAGDQWWVTNFNLAANHAVAAGAGVTVAVLDGTFSPTAPSVAGIDLVPPTSGGCVGENGETAVTGDGPGANHATQMVATLAGQGTSGPLGAAPKAKVLVYNVGISPDASLVLECRDASGGQIADKVVGAAITDAVAKGARIVSMSFGGGNLSAATMVAIGAAERKGVVVVASTNDKADVTTRVDQPSVFNGVVPVNGIDRNSGLAQYSATGPSDGPLVAAVGPGAEMALGGYTAPGQWDAGLSTGGSSPATAFVAGALATTLSRYPGATGAQLIQSLARNTGGKAHDLGVRGTDGFGFGTVSLTSMLETDPTTYPDENPLLRDNAEPPTSDIVQGGSSGSSTAPSSSAAGSSAPASPSTSATPVAAADSGSSTGLVVGLVVAGLVVLAVVVALVVVLARRGRRGGPPTAGGPPPVVAGHR